MPKFLVISYDDDQQQTLYDWVIAKDEEEACMQIGQLRGYAITVGAIPPDEMHKMAKNLEAATPETIARSLLDIAEESGLMDEDPCNPFNIEIDPDKPGWHKTSIGLVYVSEPEKHCPCGNLDCNVCGGNADWKPGMPHVR